MRYKVMNAGDIAGRTQRLGDIVELNDEVAKPLLASGNIVTFNDPMPVKKAPANPTPEEIRVRDNAKRESDLVRGQPVTPEPKPTPEEAKRRAESNPNRPFNPPRKDEGVDANPERAFNSPHDVPETAEEARKRRENTPVPTPPFNPPRGKPTKITP